MLRTARPLATAQPFRRRLDRALVEGGVDRAAPGGCRARGRCGAGEAIVAAHQPDQGPFDDPTLAAEVVLLADLLLRLLEARAALPTGPG